MFKKKQTLVLLNAIFGVQLSAGVQLVFDQQSKNESYKFTRCKRKCSFVLVLGYLSIFSGIGISIFRDVLPDAVCRFAKLDMARCNKVLHGAVCSHTSYETKEGIGRWGEMDMLNEKTL